MAAKYPTDLPGFYPREIGARLKLLRTLRGYTQPFIAGLAGMTSQAWNNNECGRDRISLPAAIKLCMVTHVTLDWIYSGTVSHLLPSDLLDAINRQQREQKVSARPSTPAKKRQRRARSPRQIHSSPQSLAEPR